MNEGTTQMRGEWSSRANVSAHTLLYTYAHPVTFSGPSLRPTIESAPEIRFYVFRRAGRTLLPSARRAFCLSGHIAAARFERQTQSLAPRQRRPTVTGPDGLGRADGTTTWSDPPFLSPEGLGACRRASRTIDSSDGCVPPAGAAKCVSLVAQGYA